MKNICQKYVNTIDQPLLNILSPGETAEKPITITAIAERCLVIRRAHF
jgi:hypothetical protein